MFAGVVEATLKPSPPTTKAMTMMSKNTVRSLLVAVTLAIGAPAGIASTESALAVHYATNCVWVADGGTGNGAPVTDAVAPYRQKLVR